MLGDMGPSVADLQAVWPFDWLLHPEFKGEALPEDGVVNAKSYPRVFAWLKRYKEVLERARERAPKLREVSGEEVLEGLRMAGWAEPEMGVDEADSLGLRKGMQVEVWPVDTGCGRRDRGGVGWVGSR